MADDEKEEEVIPPRGEEEVIPPRGADWEVVSLTASTYGFDPNDEDGRRQGSSTPMFMSGHFVFPPSEHENLPIEPEIQNTSEGGTVISAEEGEEEKQDKLDDNSQETDFFDDGSAFSAHSLEFGEGKDLESTEITNPVDSPNQDLDSRKFEKSSDVDKYNSSGHPCLAWWKKNASSLYHHAKEANTFWSIFVAAALTGLVILGKRWHRDKCHTQELRHHLSINNEKMEGAIGPMGRLKNIIISSR